jgi:aminoglycoside phosphotransferase (APT) family kinase protein
MAKGKPTKWYPYPWAIYHWMDGAAYRDELIDDEHQAAHDLVHFIGELRSLDFPGAPPGGRNPLLELDAATRSAIESSDGVIDRATVTEAWIRSLAAPPWNGKPVWIHGDLLRSNLLVHGGRLCAVIDFGGVGVGDPAADVIPAWSVFSEPGRETFRQALNVDDATWHRARGYALHQALMIIPYYPETNPEFVTLAKRTIDEILTDLKMSS